MKRAMRRSMAVLVMLAGFCGGACPSMDLTGDFRDLAEEDFGLVMIVSLKKEGCRVMDGNDFCIRM